ncbi:hypothetical protein NQ314_002417 [Rhamnusium bicolor]|uniref:Uncharacterized protein n=1 Tax=Rhamnusium bicolor TaxID=1586634 RepID=A0AAV8ZQG9_9CUCU|nr:hypothetical protein NQ314_002417 [Rhamnusium bicolor]
MNVRVFIPNIEKNELCWMGLYLPRREISRQENLLNANFPEIQRRNAELSSALNFLYGNRESKFPGKRNPEISSALLNYLNSNRN